VVLDLESVPTINVTAARMLGAMTDDLRRTGVEVRLARVVGQVDDVLITTLPVRPLLFPTIGAAVAGRQIGSASRGRTVPPPPVADVTDLPFVFDPGGDLVDLGAVPQDRPGTTDVLRARDEGAPPDRAYAALARGSGKRWRKRPPSRVDMVAA
jgi:MFS superfamily sulfate permease-like transporter